MHNNNAYKLILNSNYLMYQSEEIKQPRDYHPWIKYSILTFTALATLSTGILAYHVKKTSNNIRQLQNDLIKVESALSFTHRDLDEVRNDMNQIRGDTETLDKKLSTLENP